jgi:Domain of unknown function (DUF4145)
MFRVAGSGQQANAANAVITLRCPTCHQKATLQPFETNDVLAQSHDGSVNYVFGERRCPDPICGGQVFFVRDFLTSKLLASYPAERIDFDATNIPQAVSTTMEEAITCNANQCLIASAIMVRKTLEELCSDRKATGKNLKDRLRDLGTKIVLPKELLDGLDDLRLLGNDAAHLESQEFNQVGLEEVEIGIEFTKEVLKATYQYSALLDRLRRLKKATS